MLQTEGVRRWVRTLTLAGVVALDPVVLVWTLEDQGVRTNVCRSGSRGYGHVAGPSLEAFCPLGSSLHENHLLRTTVEIGPDGALLESRWGVRSTTRGR